MVRDIQEQRTGGEVPGSEWAKKKFTRKTKGLESVRDFKKDQEVV